MQNKSSNAAHVITSELWRVALQPQKGLQTQLCKAFHRGEWLDIMPDCSMPGAPLSASNFHMLPYSNRIRSGLFTFAGQSHQLENADSHAIHGALRELPWQIIEQSEQHIAAIYDSRGNGKINWPWPISAQVSYTVDANWLTSTMSLTNHGDQTMPAGMGWHPYFSRTVAGASPVLNVPVTGMYQDTDGDCLPIGEPKPLHPDIDFNQAKALAPDQRIDHCLAGFASPAILSWPDAGIELHVHASDNCQHLVLFNPDKPYFAVEPVTNANDGFNLQAQGIDAGVVELIPGETLHAEMRLELRTS